jgi:hypothetical protein
MIFRCNVNNKKKEIIKPKILISIFFFFFFFIVFSLFFVFFKEQRIYLISKKINVRNQKIGFSFGRLTFPNKLQGSLAGGNLLNCCLFQTCNEKFSMKNVKNRTKKPIKVHKLSLLFIVFLLFLFL